MERMIAALTSLVALSACPPARPVPGEGQPVAAEIQAVRLPDGGFLPWRPSAPQP